MDLILSLIRRDILTMPRRRFYYTARILYVGATALIVMVAFIKGTISDASTTGLVVFRNLGILMVVAACLLAPHIAASTMMQERQNRVMTLLFMSEIRPYQLVTAKMVSAILRTLMTLLTMLPLVILCASMGGISTGQIVVAFLVIFAAMFMGNCMGLLAAALGKSEVRVNNLAALCTVGGYVLLPLAALMVTIAISASPGLPTQLSPFLAMWSLLAGEDPVIAARSAVTCLSVGLVLLAAVFVILPWRFAKDIRGSDDSSKTVQRITMHPLVAKWFGRPGLLGNPILWREYYIVYGGAWSSIFSFLIWIVGTGVITFLATYMLDVKDPMQIAMYIFGAIAMVCGGYFFVGFTMAAARMFNRERQSGTIEVLMCTDLDDFAIISGKAKAIYLSLMPWLIGFALSTLGMTITAQSVGLLITMLIGAGFVILTWMAYSGMTFYFALRFRRYVEVISFGVLVLWLTLGNMVLFGLSFFLLAIGGFFGPAMLVAGPVGVGVISRGLVKKNLRRHMLSGPEA